MAFLAYQATGESCDAHHYDPLVLRVLCRSQILKFEDKFCQGDMGVSFFLFIIDLTTKHIKSKL